MSVIFSFIYDSYYSLPAMQVMHQVILTKFIAICFAENKVSNKAHISYWWILGSLGFGLVVLVLVFIFVCLRRSSCFAKTQGSNEQNLDDKTSHKFQVLRNTSFYCASGRSICCNSGDWKQTDGESSDRKMNVPKGL